LLRALQLLCVQQIHSLLINITTTYIVNVLDNKLAIRLGVVDLNIPGFLGHSMGYKFIKEDVVYTD
jgi:hypothetical protein